MPIIVHFHPLAALPPDLPRFPTELLEDLLRAEGMEDDGEVHCVLTTDEELSQLNRRFRGKDGPTDVLSFPYHPRPAGGVHGDIYVSRDRARAQARERGEPEGREVWRLFVHGALHLAGRDHDRPDTDRRLRVLQESWVARGYGA